MEFVSTGELNLVWQANRVVMTAEIGGTKSRWNGQTPALHSEQDIDTKRTVDF